MNEDVDSVEVWSTAGVQVFARIDRCSLERLHYLLFDAPLDVRSRAAVRRCILNASSERYWLDDSCGGAPIIVYYLANGRVDSERLESSQVRRLRRDDAPFFLTDQVERDRRDERLSAASQSSPITRPLYAVDANGVVAQLPLAFWQDCGQMVRRFETIQEFDGCDEFGAQHDPVPMESGFSSMDEMMALARVIEQGESAAAALSTETLFGCFRGIDCHDFGPRVTALVARELLRRLASMDTESQRSLFGITDHGFSKKDLERIEIERAWSVAPAPEARLRALPSKTCYL